VCFLVWCDCSFLFVVLGVLCCLVVVSRCCTYCSVGNCCWLTWAEGAGGFDKVMGAALGWGLGCRYPLYVLVLLGDVLLCSVVLLAVFV